MATAEGSVPGALQDRAVWELAAALSGAVASQDVATAVAEKAAAAAGALFSYLALYDQELGRVRVTHGSVLAPIISRRWEEFPLDHRTPLGSAIILGTPIWQPNLDVIGSEFPDLRLDTVGAGQAATASLPLKAPDGSVIGAIGVGWAEPQSFDDDQVTRLSLIAEVAGQALDRALLYERERKQLAAVDQAQSDLLQNTFLPARLPDTPGLEVAAAYLPASGAPMGGDWFDVFPVDGGICLVVGDVAGHGLEGTAVMAQLRNAIRAYACIDPLPSWTLARANELLCRLEPDATATCIVAVWNPDSQTLVRANAGHPPPLRCRREEFDYLTPPGDHVLLGAVAGQQFTDEEKTLRVATTVLFYTDGLIEDRTSSLDEGMAALHAFMEGLDDLSPASLCQAVVRWRSERAERDDDMCVMAIRVAERRGHNGGRQPDRRRPTPTA